MAATAPTRSSLSLRGSARTVAEFFEFSINSILYQRGIYPPDDFTIVKKFGLNLLVTLDSDIKNYIRKILAQVHRWIASDKITRLLLVIVNKDTTEVVERWEFQLQFVDEETAMAQEKSQEEVQREIQAIIRQITASVTFLPALETGEYTFNVLVYANADASVPSEWIDSDAKEIGGTEEKVKFRSFSTNSHKVDTLVSYKLND